MSYAAVERKLRARTEQGQKLSGTDIQIDIPVCPDGPVKFRQVIKVNTRPMPFGAQIRIILTAKFRRDVHPASLF
jgi:hypothetical protein